MLGIDHASRNLAPNVSDRALQLCSHSLCVCCCYRRAHDAVIPAVPAFSPCIFSHCSLSHCHLYLGVPVVIPYLTSSTVLQLSPSPVSQPAIEAAKPERLAELEAPLSSKPQQAIALNAPPWSQRKPVLSVSLRPTSGCMTVSRRLRRSSRRNSNSGAVPLRADVPLAERRVDTSVHIKLSFQVKPRDRQGGFG